jgi:signal recognition particle subunit SRP54
MASRILGMGDVLTLIEQAEAAFDEDQKERMTAKLAGGDTFTLEDFLEQMTALRRMGSITKMLGMIPGANQFKDQLAELDDKHFDKVAAIIRGMTPDERTNPKILNASRRMRIATGSGVTIQDVNQLLNRFKDAQKTMRQMGGMMGLPGMKRKATKSPKNKRKGTRGGTPRRALPGGLPAGMPALPSNLDADPFATDLAGVPPGFTAPKIDFGKLGRDKRGRG